MILFLTSSPSGPLDRPNDERVLDKSNDFIKNMRKYWKKEMKILMVSAYPDSFQANDEMKEFFCDAFLNSQLPFVRFTLWDDRMEKVDVEAYDMVILAGGHVPTQNAYFQRIQLKEKLQNYQGIVMGISAGSMNCAELVYAQPELAGESDDPDFLRFLSGLGLTSYQILPHYQMVKDSWLDGKRLYEDIAFSDSFGHVFYVLVDGSYILVDDEAILFGEGYRLQDGRIQQICDYGEFVRIS